MKKNETNKMNDSTADATGNCFKKVRFEEDEKDPRAFHVVLKTSGKRVMKIRMYLELHGR